MYSYKDKIECIKGFYKGQQGEIIGEYQDIGSDKERFFCRAYGYKVRLSDDKEVYVNQFHMKLKKERGE